MFQTEIHIKGKLNPKWLDWFEGMQIQTNNCGDTIIIGNLADRSAVYGVISRLSSLGYTLISITCDEDP